MTPISRQMEHITGELDVVTCDVQMFIALPDLGFSGLLEDYLDMLLICNRDKWHCHFRDLHGHIF